jgi:hypothetical protein
MASCAKHAMQDSSSARHCSQCAAWLPAKRADHIPDRPKPEPARLVCAMNRFDQLDGPLVVGLCALDAPEPVAIGRMTTLCSVKLQSSVCIWPPLILRQFLHVESSWNVHENPVG